jgi:hypothetical protein
MDSSIDREQLSLQQRCLRIDTAALCDDVENALGDVLCDGLDEIEEVLLAEDTVMQSPEQIRDVRDAMPRRRRLCALPALPRAASRHHTRPALLSQSVDRLTHKLRKHAEDNCKVFKSYSLQHMFRVSPEMAERLRQRETRLPTAGRGAHTAEEEAALDAELAQMQERVHAVGAHRCVGHARRSLSAALLLWFAGQFHTRRLATGGERTVAAARPEQQAIRVALVSVKQR